MDEQRHKAWRALHLRRSKGETLSEEESRAYQDGCAELDAEEWRSLSGDAAALRPLRERLRELMAQNQRLVQQEAELRPRAAELERQYMELTGAVLGLEV